GGGWHLDRKGASPLRQNKTRLPRRTVPARGRFARPRGRQAWAPPGSAHRGWRDSSPIPGRRVRVDLTNVCHVDDAGVELLMVMYRAGTRFETKGCFMPELVREISEAIDSGQAAGAHAMTAAWRS